MTVADWASEHLANFFLDLCAALGAAWLFFRFQPTLSDWRARRSTNSLRKRIVKLQEELSEFEELYADSRDYIAYMIVRSLFVILYFSITTMIFAGWFTSNASMTLKCVNNKCETWDYLEISVPFFVVTLLSSSLFFRRLFKIVSQSSAERYRSDMNKRIARLQARLQVP